MPGCGGLAGQAEPVVLTRGDVERLDAVEAGNSRDGHDVPAQLDDVAFTTDDWLGLLKPMGDSPSVRSARTWKRISGMVAVISGIALVVVTFSSGGPIADERVNLETSAGSDSASDRAGGDPDDSGSMLPLRLGDGVDVELPSSPEAAFLGLVATPSSVVGSEDSTTTTTVQTTTTAGWSEPVIPPESDWVDAGNGVVVPDVLLRIRYCESTNNYKAAHTVSSARGAYQFLTKSWGWYGHAARYGVASADQAAPAQQDEAAVLTLRRDGTRPWLASWSCWGSGDLPANYATAGPPPQPTTTSTTADATSSSSGSVTTDTSSPSTTATTSSTETTASTSTSESTTSTDPSTTTSDSTGSTTSEAA